MSKTTKVRRTARTKRASRKFTLPISEGVIEANAELYQRMRRDDPDAIPYSPTCHLHFAVNHARAVAASFRRAQELGATKRDVAAVCAELMLES